RNSPAVIIGLNQNPYAEVNLPYLQEHGIALVRRITGGGAVYHDLGNLNYSIVGPSKCFETDKPVQIVEALRAMGVPAELGGRNDIFVDGRKCSGYAKRLSRDRMMIHGTLMFDVDLEALVSALATPGSKVSSAGIASVRSRVANLRDYLPGFTMVKFTAALQEYLAGGDNEISPRAALGLDDKFRSWEWIYGRSPQAEFSRSVKLGCGTLQLGWSLRHGCLSGVHFGGDFIGLQDPTTLAARLEGVPFTREAITPLLQDAPSFFDSTSPDDLLAAFDLP
ncbi:MAG: lipoate--protein ligase, partial [Bacteroidales bacterium]|nr:lipoate--protein ligase [Bacteroidales bacterium]